MPSGINILRRKSFSDFVDDQLDENSINDLSVEGGNLLSLMTLLVDIEFRKAYGKSLDRRNFKGYSNSSNNMPSEQEPLFDSGSEGVVEEGFLHEQSKG